MDDYRDVERARLALLEKIILDAGLRLPGIYEGLHGKELREHERKMLNRILGKEG